MRWLMAEDGRSERSGISEEDGCTADVVQAGDSCGGSCTDAHEL